MRSNNKIVIRQLVEKEGWTIIWPCGIMPNEYADEQVKLLFEDMDGYVCSCDAVYTYNREDKLSHKPYFKRISDGAKMINCLAWKY